MRQINLQEVYCSMFSWDKPMVKAMKVGLVRSWSKNAVTTKASTDLMGIHIKI